MFGVNYAKLCFLVLVFYSNCANCLAMIRNNLAINIFLLITLLQFFSPGNYVNILMDGGHVLEANGKATVSLSLHSTDVLFRFLVMF